MEANKRTILVVITEMPGSGRTILLTVTSRLAPSILLVTIGRILQDTLVGPLVAVTTASGPGLLRQPSGTTEAVPGRPMDRETSLVVPFGVEVGLTVITAGSLAPPVPPTAGGDIILGRIPDAVPGPTVPVEQPARFRRVLVTGAERIPAR